MKWMVAPSYANATIVKVDETNHKAYIEGTCTRCGGLGIIVARVENNQPIPIPVDGGVCYRCGGSGKEHKWVKAYTEKEYASYIKAQERSKERKAKAEADRKQALLDNSEANKEAKLRELGYDPMNPVVYVVTGGNTYAIKDDLKAAGFKFNKALGWYCTHEVAVPAPYFLLSFAFDEVFIWENERNNGYIYLTEDAGKKVKAAIEASYPESNSEFLPYKIKERFYDLEVTFNKTYTFSSLYGESHIYEFLKDQNKIQWITTSTNINDIKVGDKVFLTATIKKFDIYKNEKITYVSRAKIRGDING